MSGGIIGPMTKPRKPRIPPIWYDMMPGDTNAQIGPPERLHAMFAEAEKQGMRFAIDTESIQHVNQKWFVVIRLPEEIRNDD